MENYTDTKIFIIDDDPLTSALYEQHLKNKSFNNIQVFNEGQLAINALVEQPEIVLLDHQMDEMDGVEVLRKIKRFNPDIYVIFISGQEEIDIAVTSLKYGAFDYIVKGPNDTNKISQVISKIFEVKEDLKMSSRGPLKKALSFLL